MTNFSSLASVYAQLTSFANLSNFWSLFNTAFGSSYDSAKAATFKLQWQNQNFSQFPQIEVVSNGVLGTANGAYAISTNKIYLSDSFISSASQQSLDAVILEEIGHFVDALVNSTDTVGDEGELFSALIRGESLSPETIALIKAENDSATIIIDGEEVAIETSSDFTHPMPGSVKTWGIWEYPGHTGLDLDYTEANRPATPWVLSAQGGKVINVVSNVNYNTWNTGQKIYGNLVTIDHGNGYHTLYAHLKSVSVSKGQTVAQGQTIGVMGNTGYSSSEHLHFEIRRVSSTGRFISYEDPWPLINGSVQPEPFPVTAFCATM